ncbi:Phage minor capsid protein 2 [Micrococcales bacterium KH10]|nr:Phage minor capsid protein 2 [Micrococcales bacterium KH10]
MAWLPDDRGALWWLAQDLAAVFGEAEQELVKVLASELRDLLTDDPEQLAARVTRLTKSREAAERLAEQLSEYTHEQIPQILDTAAQHGANAALTEVAKAATLPPVAVAGPIGAPAVTALAGDLTNALDVVTQRVLRFPDDVWRRTVAQTSTNVLLGLDTGRQAQARAWQKILTEGVTFIDKSNRRWNTATYVEMATRTATRRAWEAQHVATMADHGINLVTITVGSRACEKCAAWDGKILRTDPGPTGDVVVDRADGDGTMTVYIAGTLDQAKEHGWLHPNCRCRPVAYLPGISRVETNTHFDPEGHANEQELRRLEREVRKAKMEEAAALTPEQKKAAREKVRARQAQIRDHVDKTGVPRRREREQLNYGHRVEVDGKQTRATDGLPSSTRLHQASIDQSTRPARIVTETEDVYEKGLLAGLPNKQTDPPDLDVAAWKQRQGALDVNFHGETLDPAEVRFAERFVARNERFEWIPRNRTGADGKLLPTNDFTWISREGEEWELKSPQAPEYEAVKNRLRDDIRKGKTRFMVDVGEEEATPQFLRGLQRYAERRGLDGVIVLSENGHRLTRVW